MSAVHTRPQTVRPADLRPQTATNQGDFSFADVAVDGLDRAVLAARHIGRLEKAGRCLLCLLCVAHTYWSYVGGDILVSVANVAYRAVLNRRLA
jgi:hypothetical protein